MSRVPVGVHAVVLRVALRLLGEHRGPDGPQQRTEQANPGAETGSAVWRSAAPGMSTSQARHYKVVARPTAIQASVSPRC